MLTFGGWHRAKAVNPAVWKHNLEHANLPKPSKIAKVKHHAAYPWQDIREHMTALQRDSSIAAMALQFAITAAGTNEIRLAPSSEIDIKHRIWRIPASRMKADRPQRVPLSDGRRSFTGFMPACRQPRCLQRFMERLPSPIERPR